MPITYMVHSDPEIMLGTAVFVGTRVPVQSLMDYLTDGDSLQEFMLDYPTVSREMVIQAMCECLKVKLLNKQREVPLMLVFWKGN